MSDGSLPAVPAAGEGILERVRQIYPGLSRNQKRIADGILENWETVAFVSPRELGLQVGVSEATVIRLARSLGYESFSALRRHCQELVRKQLTPARQAQAAVRGPDSATRTVEQLLTGEVENLKRGISRVSAEDMGRSVELIRGARRVFLIGQGVSVSLCTFLEFRFRRMQIDTRLLVQAGKDLFENLLLLEPRDVVIGIGFFRCRRDIVQAFDYARRVGAPRIAVTHSTLSELALRATVTLVANRGPVSLLNSLVVPMAVLNALVLLTAQGDESKMEALRRLDRIPDLFGRDGNP